MHERAPENPREKVIVIGSGIMGLTAGIRLLEEGHEVEIWTDRLPDQTTSMRASFWVPFASEPDPNGRDKEWGQDTYDTLLEQLSEGAPGLGICNNITIFPDKRPDPDWSAYVPGYSSLDRNGLKQEAGKIGMKLPHHAQSGYTVKFPTFDMGPYLGYLTRMYERLGGATILRKVNSISEPLKESDIVVNCAGLGAKELVRDKKLVGVHGVHVKTTRPDDVSTMIIDDYGPQGMTNIMPHAKHLILGGIAEKELSAPVEDIADAIYERCCKVLPALRDAYRCGNYAGTRPCRRTGIRLESRDTKIPGQNRPEKRVIHNYGHGGSGVTFSWGCANEVVRMVQERRAA